MKPRKYSDYWQDYYLIGIKKENKFDLKCLENESKRVTDLNKNVFSDTTNCLLLRIWSLVGHASILIPGKSATRWQETPIVMALAAFQK